MRQVYSALSFLFLNRPVILVVIATIVPAVLAGCERDAVGQRALGSPAPQTREATQRAATATAEAATATPKVATPIPTVATATSVPPRVEMELKVNRIAYTGADGNIFTINSDGTNSRRLTTTDLRVGPGGHIMAQGSESQVFYAWPTWSPDNTLLAASRVTVDGAAVSFSLEVVDTVTGIGSRIYDNEPETAPIAQGTPHYILWSPDSRHLTFIAAKPTELVLFISTPDGPHGATRLIGEAPIYFSWSGASDKILIHRGTQLLLASPTDPNLQEPMVVGAVDVGFRAPAFSLDGNSVLYAVKDDSGTSIFVADIPTTTGPQGSHGLAKPRSLLNVGDFSVFLRSPTRDELAVADTLGTEGRPYERLTLVSTDGTPPRTLVDEPLQAFFWSRDGDKIVYVAEDPENRGFIWKLVDRTGGEPVHLSRFLPSAEFLLVISFFDQYAHSNLIWSPDSSQIVFSGSVGEGGVRRNGGSPEGDRVYVLDVKEGAVPREIATGRYAVWSWK